MPNRRRYAVLGLLTISICVVALYIYRHRQGQTGKIDDMLIGVAGSAQTQVSYLTRGIREIADHYLLLVNAKKRSEELEKEVFELRSHVASLKEGQAEVARMREALGFKEALSESLLAAHVVSHDVSPDYQGIRIDRGTQDGVRVGLGVVSPSGVVGKVLRVTSAYSDVLTLLDPTSNIDAVVQRTRSRGILSGQSRQMTCRLKYIDRLEDIQVNDTLVSSGYGSIFPKGLLMGYVTAVIPNPSGVVQTVTVRSAVDIYRLEEVFIVFPPNEPEKIS